MSLKIYNSNGMIDISNEVFTTISGWLAMNCFGVRGMAARSVSDGIVHILQRESVSKGIKVELDEDESARIELHIIVEHGVNIPAVSESIMGEVSYMVEKYTSVKVSKVDVYIDGMMTGR
ncbi:MAG: Asp23/Gls24 family envelope stress response protein [Oscillospiraceae bacterium]|nr:Asp23/Gls24 family envelope stress response protein [Oscillospiraceae bacterium]